MSKRAEEAAMKAYPVEMTPLNYQDLIDQFGGKTEIDVNTYSRCLFQEGYEQAEKDLALTWEDIRTIFSLLDETARLLWFQNKKFNDKELCEETLRKFNEAKESKQ